MLALPLTEPALAAATSAAEAAAGSTDDVTLMNHPAVSVDVWVEHQTQQQTEVVAAVAADDVISQMPTMATAAATADDVISAQDDITIIITTDDDAGSTIKSSQQQQLVLVADIASVASSADLISSGSNAGCGSNGSSSKAWWFCMSPDACNNPITWWVGEYDGNRFDIAAADGPHRLDLGTTLYAATFWEDPQVSDVIFAGI